MLRESHDLSALALRPTLSFNFSHVVVKRKGLSETRKPGWSVETRSVEKRDINAPIFFHTLADKGPGRRRQFIVFNAPPFLWRLSIFTPPTFVTSTLKRGTNEKGDCPPVKLKIMASFASQLLVQAGRRISESIKSMLWVSPGRVGETIATKFPLVSSFFFFFFFF